MKYMICTRQTRFDPEDGTAPITLGAGLMVEALEKVGMYRAVAIHNLDGSRQIGHVLDSDLADEFSIKVTIDDYMSILTVLESYVMAYTSIINYAEHYTGEYTEEMLKDMENIVSMADLYRQVYNRLTKAGAAMWGGKVG